MSVDNNNDNNNAPTILASNKSIQEATWSGSLPIVISLAPTSISSPTPPRPIHKMISRVSYLHLALHDVIMQLSSYAPTHTLLASKFDGMLSVAEPPDSPGSSSGDNNNNKGNSSSEDNTNTEDSIKDTNQTNKKPDVYPECWFEDEESGTPLRWNLFVGVLYDIMKGKSIINKCCTSPSSSTSWKDKLNQHNFLPWRIRVHFTSYPTDDILPLNDGCNIQQQPSENNSISSHEHITTILRSIYRNSLKQALFMQYNSSKVAMSITKNSHEKVWDAVLQSNYTLYNEVNVDLQSGVSSPAISSTVSMATSKDEDIPQLIPIRVMLNGKTAMQRPIRHEKESENIEQKRPREILEELGTSHAPPHTTLGDVLLSFLPNHFNIDSSSGWVSIASDTTLYYSIQGVQPSLKCAMVDIWRALSHPDHFLYLIIVVNE